MEYTLVGGTFTIKSVNTWGLGLISSNREGVKRYFHFDGLGSTRALTDSSGNEPKPGRPVPVPTPLSGEPGIG